MISKVLHQAKFDLLIFRRNPAATFFTLILPLIFLVLFTALFGNNTTADGIKVSTFYVPGILALAIVSATAVNLAITMTTRRERGVLKRIRSTPLPSWVFIASQAIGGLVLSILMTLIISVLGTTVYGAEFPIASLPSLVITLIVGATSLTAVGLAMTVIIPSEDAAPAVTNAIMLPLYFISGIFVPDDDIPSWVSDIGSLFPVSHLNQALQEFYLPQPDGADLPRNHWLVIAGWGIVCAGIALKWFRWTPRR